MLRFESVYWATVDAEKLSAKMSRLGFSVTPSERDPQTNAINFGPDSIEIFSPKDTLSTLSDNSGLTEFVSRGAGIFGISVDSDNIAADYQELMKSSPLEKPRVARNMSNEMPLWTGFNLPATATPPLRGWIVMNSPQVLHKQTRDVLPTSHPNSCFGIEAIHVVSKDPAVAAGAWSKIVDKHSSSLQWNELALSEGRRIQAGDRFLDFLPLKDGTSIEKVTHGREGVFMLTLKVTDLEHAKRLMLRADVQVAPCQSRDGFIVSSEFTGGPALRFVRAAWKRYLPLINDNYPFGRRTDAYRPLGGADSSTLEQGYVDDYNH